MRSSEDSKDWTPNETNDNAIPTNLTMQLLLFSPRDARGTHYIFPALRATSAERRKARYLLLARHQSPERLAKNRLEESKSSRNNLRSLGETPHRSFVRSLCWNENGAGREKEGANDIFSHEPTERATLLRVERGNVTVVL